MDQLLHIDTAQLGSLNSKPWLQQAETALQQLETKACPGSEWTGWYDWPRLQGFRLQREIAAWKARLGFSYDTVVVCGIGGSYLGTRAVASALGHSLAPYLETSGKRLAHKPILYAGHNLSEKGLIELLEVLEERSPLINVISKSGTTTEPGIAFRVLRKYLESRYQGDAAQRIVVTTDPHQGQLRAMAEELHYQSFAIPADVGGRFSVLTAVGLVPLELAGYPTSELLAGADRLFASLDPKQGTRSQHAAVQVAAIRRAAWEEGRSMEVLAYAEPQLAALVEWWKQLFGESEGKEGKGLFPVGVNYSTDLHSLGQYMQEGKPSMLETFLMIENSGLSGDGLQVEKGLRVPHVAACPDGLDYLEGQYFRAVDKAAMVSALKAHADRGLPCLRLNLPRLDAYHTGYLLAFWQVTCALSAALLQVNPFDQPGVEAYKVKLFELMGKPC